MSGFKDMVEADIKSVFLNVSEFADLHTVKYDGVTYEDIPVLLTKLRQEDRRQLVTTSDHAQGMYRVSEIMHCAVADLGGKVPEKGMKIQINDGPVYFRQFFVASSECAYGVVRVELEAIDE